MMRCLATSIAVCATMCMVAPHVQAQRSASERAAHDQLLSELAQLREAAAYEARGDYARAEKIVSDVLTANPASLSGILTMERVLTAQGRTAEIMPAVDRLLAQDASSVIGHQTRLRVLSDLDEVERLAQERLLQQARQRVTPQCVFGDRATHEALPRLLSEWRQLADVKQAEQLAVQLGRTEKAFA